MIRRAAPLLVLALLLGACSDGGAEPRATDQPVPTTPVPSVTLPAGSLSQLVLAPEEVPSGMLPILKGTGPRTVDVVAGYSGTGPAQASAKAKLSAHGFVEAYVVQYADPATGQVLSVLASQFRTAGGAQADLADDLKSAQGRPVTSRPIGEQSGVTVQPLNEKPAAELVIVRFRRGTTTWSLAYKAATPANPQVAIDLANKLLARTAT